MYMSAFTKFTRHPAMESSAPSTLTAQIPREYVRAVRFSGSHQAPRQVPVTNLEDLSFRKYNQFQDSIDNMGFKPILRPQPDQSVFSPIDGLMDKSGSGLFDFLDPNKNGVAKAFDPKRNGVANAFDPNKNGVAKAFDPKQNGVANAFDPNKNGVANAFDPNKNGVANAFDPNKNGVANALDPTKNGLSNIVGDVGKKFVSILIHQGLPFVGQLLGQQFGMGDMGKSLATKGADALGTATGYGIQIHHTDGRVVNSMGEHIGRWGIGGRGVMPSFIKKAIIKGSLKRVPNEDFQKMVGKVPSSYFDTAIDNIPDDTYGKIAGMGFKKGSPEMKAHMAKLRSMRKKK